MYYRLTYRNVGGSRKGGGSITCAGQPLDIGQTDGCQLLLPQSDQYEPLLFATILPLEKGGWCIVRRTDCIGMEINGEPLRSAVCLNDGDNISFSYCDISSQMVFNIRTDGNSDDARGVVYRRNSHRRTLAITVVVALAALVVASIALFASSQAKGLHRLSLDNLDASVYRIMADSVILVRDTVIDGVVSEVEVECVTLDPPQTATCFLTADGWFVTARHCIEPWVADETWDGISDTAMPAHVRLALLAETANRQGYGRWRVRTHCTISVEGDSHEYWSDEFIVDRSRDLVVQLGTGAEPVWLRTIVPVATRRDMELGDLACIKAPEIKGGFEIAGKEDLERFNGQPDREIAVLGYPEKDNEDGRVTHLFGNSQYVTTGQTSSRERGCIQMSAQINPGNSGGPIVACIAGRVKVIGVVSKSDMHASQGTFWAVPSTEIVRSVNYGTDDRESEVQNIYRR